MLGKKIVYMIALIGLAWGLAGCSPVEMEFVQAKAEQMNWVGVSDETELKISFNEDGYSAGYTITVKSRTDLQNGGAQMIIKGVSDTPYYPSIESFTLYMDPEGCFYVSKNGLVKFLEMSYESEMAATLAETPGDYLYFNLEDLMENTPGMLSSGVGVSTWNRQSVESMERLIELSKLFQDFSLDVTKDGNTFKLKIDASNGRQFLTSLGQMVTNHYEDMIAVMPWSDDQKEMLLDEAYYVKRSFSQESLNDIYQELFVKLNASLGFESINTSTGYQDNFWLQAHDDMMQLKVDFTSKGSKLDNINLAYPAKEIDGIKFIEDYYDSYYDSYDYDTDYHMATIDLDTKLMKCQLGIVPLDMRVVDDQVYIAALNLAGILYEGLYWDEEALKVYSYYGGEVYLDGVLIEEKGAQVYYIKLRDIEQLGYYVNWNEETREVEIGY